MFAPSTAHPTAKRRGCAAESNATAWQILIAGALYDRLVAGDPEEPIHPTTITLDPKGRCWSAATSSKVGGGMYDDVGDQLTIQRHRSLRWAVSRSFHRAQPHRTRPC